MGVDGWQPFAQRSGVKGWFPDVSAIPFGCAEKAATQIILYFDTWLKYYKFSKSDEISFSGFMMSFAVLSGL